MTKIKTLSCKPLKKCFVLRVWRSSLFSLIYLICGFIGIMILMVAEENKVPGWIYLFIFICTIFTCVLGIYLLLGKYIAAYLEWRNISYEIRTDRVIIHRGVLSKKKDVFPLMDIDEVSVFFSGKGIGHIFLGTLESSLPFVKLHFYWPISGKLKPPAALYCIENAKEVVELIKRLKKQISNNSSINVHEIER